MARLKIFNPGKEPVLLGDFYTSVQPGAAVLVDRPAVALGTLPSLRRALRSQQVALAVDFTPAEEAGIPDVWGWAASQLLS